MMRVVIDSAWRLQNVSKLACRDCNRTYGWFIPFQAWLRNNENEKDLA